MSHASTFDNLFNKYYNTYLLKSIKKNRGNNILFFKEKFKVEFKVVIHDASKNNDWGNSYLNLIGDRVILYQNNNNLVYHDFKSSNILDCYTKLEFNTDKNKICLNFKYKKKNKSTNDILICPIRKNVVDYQFMTNKISNLCTQNIDHFLKEIFYNKLNSCDFFSKLKGHSQEFLLKESYNFIKHKVELLSEKRERKLRNNLISFFKTMCKGILNNYLDNFKEDTKLLKIVSNLIHAKPCECKEDNKKNETKSQDPYTKRKKCFKKRDENLNIGYRGCNITKSLTISDKSKNKSKENINVTKTHNGDNYISYQNESINPNKLTGNSSKIKIKINQTRHVNCYNKNNIEIHKNQSDTQKNLVRSSQIIDLNNTERLRINNKSANLNEESIILYKLYQHYFFNKNGIPSQLLLNSNIQPNKNMRLNVANLTINLIKESSSLFKAPSQFRTFNRLDNKPSIKIDQDCNRNDIYCLCKSHPQYKNCVCLAYPKSVVCLKNYCIYHDSDYECSPLICDKPNIEKTDKCYCKHNIEDLRCKCKTNPFSQDCFCLQFPLSHLCNKRSCHFNPYSIFCSCRTSKGEGLCSGRYCINHPNDAYCNCITNPITGSCKCLNDPRSCSKNEFIESIIEFDIKIRDSCATNKLFYSVKTSQNNFLNDDVIIDPTLMDPQIIYEMYYPNDPKNTKSDEPYMTLASKYLPPNNKINNIRRKCVNRSADGTCVDALTSASTTSKSFILDSIFNINKNKRNFINLREEEGIKRDRDLINLYNKWILLNE